MPKYVIDVSIIWLDDNIYSRNTWFPTTDVQTQNIGKLRYANRRAPTECQHTVATPATEYQRWRDVGCRSRRCRPMPTLGQRRNASWDGFVLGLFGAMLTVRSQLFQQTPEENLKFPKDRPLIRLIVTGAEWRIFWLVWFYSENFPTISYISKVTLYRCHGPFYLTVFISIVFDGSHTIGIQKRELHIGGKLSKSAQYWSGYWQRPVSPVP